VNSEVFPGTGNNSAVIIKRICRTSHCKGFSFTMTASATDEDDSINLVDLGDILAGDRALGRIAEDLMATGDWDSLDLAEWDSPSPESRKSSVTTSDEESASSVVNRRIRDKGVCAICKVQAAEYKYYGARSCQSCRAFFRYIFEYTSANV